MWHRPYAGGSLEPVPIDRCICTACQNVSFWSTVEKVQIFPKSVAAPMPHADMPDTCKEDYMEGRMLAADSPRAAAAILRLCIQKLLHALGGKGRSIDEDTAWLVAQGLPREVIDALDFCRVIGNNAVHPGEISLKEDPEIVTNLFELINFIVRETVERKNTLKQLMSKLPQGALDAIDRRDAKAINAAALPAPPSGP